MTNLPAVTPILIDDTNFDDYVGKIIVEIESANTIGFDIETFDEAHEGIQSYRNKKRLVFDYKRTTVAGFSVYADGSDKAYYINLNHADIQNRLSWEKARVLLDTIKPSQTIVSHNAPFEIAMMGESLGFEFGDNINCSLQLCVSAYGPDEYDHNKWLGSSLGDVKKVMKEAGRVFRNHNKGDNLTPEHHDYLRKVLAKSGTTPTSYEGFIKTIAYGYGLKKAVKSWFNYEMASFEDTLGDKEHMGQLTGAEVVSYGADDAVWCVRLFNKVLMFMITHAPKAIEAYRSQENPMIHIYADLARQGVRVNYTAIGERETIERQNYAEALRKLKTACNKLLPFPTEPHKKLAEMEKWYAKDPDKHRDKLQRWLDTPNTDDDYEQCIQVSSAVPNAWAGRKMSDLSIQHYFQVRLIMYDLMQMEPYVAKGKVQSDGDTRGLMKRRIDNVRTAIKEDGETRHEFPDGLDPMEWINTCDDIIDAYNELTGIEQRCKLYITPYLQLTDPDTDRMYPVLSSKLATRRMAMSYPNGMQLSKRGESTYVRGFFLPDEEDHVLISLDWSQIELVLIGEFSGDPEFYKAYGQLPYQDLHLGAAAEVLQVLDDSITEEMMLNVDRWDDKDIAPSLLMNAQGQELIKGKRRGYWRTAVGKGSNFNYWYSGALNTVGENLGWTSAQMWAATEKYRERFAVAEEWRTKVITDGRFSGYVELKDGLRRYKREVTYQFANEFRNIINSFNNKGITNFADICLQRIQSRAGNQLVNAEIQGSCATLAKRSALAINQQIKADQWRARFIMPIHDELLFSVHKDDAVAFIPMAKTHMANHPEIISNLKVDSTASVGLTFEPWGSKAPIGQIEVDEAPAILGFEEDSKMTDDQIKQTIDYLFETRGAL